MDSKRTTQTKTTMKENETIIEQILGQTRGMLESHWGDINDYRNGGEAIKISFLHKLAYEGQERVVDTTFSIGKRMKDKTVNRIDLQQLSLDLPAPGAKRTRKKKPAPLVSITSPVEEGAESGEAA